MCYRKLHIPFLFFLLSLFVQAAQAQLVRYVTTTGTYAGDGLSWATAKNNLQDAINDLHNYMQQKGISEGGRIYVAQGKYVPTESTEQAGGGVLFTSFKMYAGISVYGGYKGDEIGDALEPDNRPLKGGATKPWEMKYQTILSGNHSSTQTVFQWDPTNKKEVYTTSFPGNSYHVVWFATNGLDDKNRAKPLGGTSLLDGCIIEDGNASNRSVETMRVHTAFGAGIYMTAGAKVDRCIVRHNESTRRGGGIYLDNGGEVDRCYIYANQCLGIGIVAGYGGGVCVDDEGKVLRSLIHNNVARIGGGACLSAETVHQKAEENAIGVNTSDCFNPALAGCVVSNNTSTTEAGGVFMYKGGQMNHNTIVRNKCTGPNVIISGRRYGRSAGVYVDKAAMITNSVLWGGQVDANSDVQYASYTVESTELLYPYISYTAVSNHDLADWTSTSKLEVLALGTKNTATSSTDNQYYPRFLAATSGIDPDNIKPGVEADNATATPETRWMPAGFSPLREHGVQIVDIATYDRALISHLTTDMNGNTYAARTTIGAYVPTKNTYTPRLLPSVEPGESGDVLTLFVDPNRNLTTLSGEDNVGHSWEKPLGNINDALSWFNENKGKTVKFYANATTTTLTPTTINNDTKLQVLVKAGTCTTAGSYFSSRMRSSSIRMYNNARLYGGYPADATGTSRDGRNPSENLTTISANIINNGYEFNTCHILGFNDASNAIVDGFRLSYACSLPNEELNNSVDTSSPIYFIPALKDGGAIVIQNAVGNYGSMTNNKVRNCILSNCTSNQGAAIFVQSSRPEVKISLDVENCIIHNNTATTTTTPAAVWVESESGTGGAVTVNFNHCDFLKNVGYGLYVKGGNATVKLDNSVVWANASAAMDRSEYLAEAANAGKVRTWMTENGGNLSGSYNFFDTGTSTTGFTNSQSTLTYVDDVTNYTYPIFVNPTKNIGATQEGDLTKYGGHVNFMPRNMNPIVNAAVTSNMAATDLTSVVTRSYGGAADVGAVENTFLPENGNVFYVTPTGAGRKDGSSWSNAIAGNEVYDLTTKTSLGIQTTADAYLTGTYKETSVSTSGFWDSGSGNTINTDWKGKLTGVTITNNRYERYISGLQFAVETASSASSSADKKEVWIAGGTYTDYKGYVIRDKIIVYGGFPDFGTPGMDERHPLLSTSIPVSKTNQNLESQIAHYETILQISSTESVKNNGNFVSPADWLRNESSVIRRPVLRQPDVCLPTYGPAKSGNLPGNLPESNNGTYASNTYRFPGAENGKTDANYVEYEGAVWDGFTIQNGYIVNYYANRDGGAGVRMFRGVTLRNSVVKRNMNYSTRNRGGGVYCDGSNSVVENCFIFNNNAEGRSNEDFYGGGMYMIVGTGFNLLVTRNYATSNGGGLFIENATFYNNTVAYNNSEGCGGIYQWSGDYLTPSLDIFNCLLYGNNHKAIDSKLSGTKFNTNFKAVMNCYIQTAENLDSKFSIYNKIGNSNYLGTGTALDNPFDKGGNAVTALDFSLSSASKCINSGLNDPNNITLPETDVDFTARIQDCTVDIGAYEYNGAYDIVPTSGTAADDITPTATYYVTGPGDGTASAQNPANAACMQKLQKVLDAAGRYKFTNPGTQVIVKLARVAGGGYAPSRSYVTEKNSTEADNPRTYSLMVPRGVEVWGGYLEEFEEDKRDVIANSTLLTGAYTSDGQNVNCYHVVTFTDNLFDEDGELIGTGHTTSSYNGITDPTLNPALSTASTKLDPKKDRAILDGLYIEDGDAEGEIITSSEADINRYGGAAIVPDYAHVRNCILRNNTAANGGGALFLQEGALVSGCILTDNSAEKGGAIYVQQNTTANFDPTKWNYIRNFAHIISCTISDNEATSSGGGLWFNNNVRVNSSVLWNNKSNNAANVNGQTDPFSTQAESNTSVFYPFSYSAVENIRMAGMNNISVSTTNEKGVRFVSRANKDGNDYYYLQHYSVLARSGMSQQDYTNIRISQPAETDMRFYFPTLEAEDMAGNSRTTYNMNGSTLVDPPGEKDFVEIGARSYNGPLLVTPTADNLITRLFVVKPEDIDEDIFEAMSSSPHNFVEGCSFAFPMQKLDDALLYVQTARKTLGKTEVNGTKVKDTKFEIFVSRGTYYPYRTVTGQYSYSRGNTFLVPEGVSIFGGLRDDLADGTNTDSYFYTSTDPNQNLTLTATITVNGSTTTRRFTLKGQTTENILRARELEDLNHNSLMEPWEMKYQTILSGKSVNSETADNVYHVITCIADEDYVGTLPTPTNTTATPNIDNHTREHTGVPILLDGLQIMDGKALGYDAASVANAYSYYKGGGVLVDGNWQKPTSGSWNANGTVDTSDEIHSRSTDPAAVGKRCIPLVVRNCEFTNNRAGAGGAIYSNGVVEIFSSNFAQNASKQRDEVSVTPLADLPETSTKYNGNGGAIYSTYVLSAINTIFANNEAGLVEETADLNNLTDKGSRGGAVFHGATAGYGSLQMVNCNFVRNQALSYPAIYLCYPNRGDVNMSDNPHKVVNSIFWANEVTPDCTISGTEKQVNFVCSYWNRVPTDGAMAEDPSVFTDARLSADGITPGIGENLWFCAYEEGRGCVPRMDDRGTIDYRTISYTLNEYIPNLFKTGTYWENGDNGTPVMQPFDNNGTKYIWVTNNIYLSDENNALNGPNFVNPSLGPGVNNYLPSADWMMSRQNNLTDNGWSRIQQQIQLNDVTQNYDCSFVTDASGDYIAQGIYADTRNNRKDNNYIKMPIGNEKYMEFTDGSPMFRISKDPNPSQNQTYIDLGVYEYQHIQLNPKKGDETDVLWVSTQEKPENGVADGSSWRQPTSDMQRAIETLLASRNNHHKQINVIEGNYSPIYTIDGYMAFTINSGSLNAAATLPLVKDRPGGEIDGDLGVKSLTILGGWSKDVENLYSTESYPTTWEMAGRSGVAMDKMSTLLRIVDTHNWYNVGSYASRISATQKNDGDNTQRVIPITIDGITFQNVYGNKTDEGAAIYYSDQYQFSDPTERDETKHSDVLAAASADGAPKLKLGRSIFRLNGNAATVPAVTIGQGGGHSLVYNTLFHSNMGQSLRAYNTHVVNCTFALNGDKLKLLDDRSATTSTHSLLMNSLLWRNGAANQDDDPTDAYEYELPSVTADYLAHNAIYGNVYTGDDTVNPDDGVISIKVGEGSYNTTNHSLTGTNSDVLGGPNFMNPLPQAVSEDDKLLRDFHLRPSARTINQGDDLTYAKQALDKATALTDAEKLAETDLAYMPRFKSAGIDRGAYEFQGELQRVIYIDPNKMTTGTGETWGSPYGHGDLQSAIDLAAVFYTINGQRAYVFCKGGQKTGETLTPRAGVNVYAGIASNYTREATKEKTDDGDDTDGGFAEEDLHDYITYVLGDRTGIVTPNASRTGISGIQTTGAYPVYALMDGFDVTPAANVTRPVIDLGDADKALPVAVRNSVVHDTYNINMVSENGAAAAVRLRGGLLYNVLVRDCPASQPDVAATWLGTKARAVNCTFLGKGENGYAIETKASVPQVFHSITWNPDHTGSEPVTRLGTTASAYQNCNTNEEGYPFARYLQPVADNHPARPAAYTGNQDLWYQLEEMSKQMDCTATGITHEALYSNLQSALGLTETERQTLIDYSSDRDLLGNPRLPQYNPLIDRGCYETWNVPEGKAAKATYAYTGESSRGHLAGGRRHPQEGSVVYVQKNASLVMSSDDFNPASTTAAGRNEVLRPGYLLLREGASLYSEGTAVSLPHVGVERTISNADAGALVALPYAFNYSQARLVSYHEAGGQLQQAVPGAGTEVFYYDGAQRAEGGYEAQTQDSPCWKPWTAGEREACMGVWYKPATAGTYRFTAADVTALGTDPIYREGYYGDTSEKQKTVSLTQADNRNTNGSKPDYTTPENMGWNLVGCPYLVSNYVSWANDEATDFDPEAYPMSLPRFVYTTNAAGQFTSWPSWKHSTEGSFAPAHAFFTQTATLQATEVLTFTLPHCTDTPVAAVPRPCLSFTDGAGRSDVVTLQPSAEATDDMGFHLGSDGLHWAPLNPELPQLYAASTGAAHLDWMGAVPVGTEIPLGLNSGTGGLCTFSLPSPEAYATFTHVWLTDRQAGRVTDLKQHSYTVPLEADETTDIRFTLKFGGIAPNPGASGEQALYQITARQGYIHIEGLLGGENIAVYDTSGRLQLSDHARTNHYAAPFLPGNYVVKVEGYSRKVLVMP